MQCFNIHFMNELIIVLTLKCSHIVPCAYLYLLEVMNSITGVGVCPYIVCVTLLRRG